MLNGGLVICALKQHQRLVRPSPHPVPDGTLDQLGTSPQPACGDLRLLQVAALCDPHTRALIDVRWQGRVSIASGAANSAVRVNASPIG